MKPTADTRVIRVFISSTFRDMQEERDYLVKFIFPQVRKLCETRGVVFSEVDLRWGITDEQAAEGQVLPICLAEIQRSRPYFIGLLGERYGWIPDTIDPELIEREPWLAEHKNHSVTELEILHGVLNDPEMANHALFYFRNPDYIKLLDSAVLSDFIEVPWREDIEKYGMEEAQRRVEERNTKLHNLKDRIRKSGFPVRENYQNPKEMGEWVLNDLIKIINDLYPPESELNPLEKERVEQDLFAANYTGVYVGGEKYYRKIDSHLANHKKPLVILGESGSGKSALLANWATRYRTSYPNELVIMHFISSTPGSTDLSAMLMRIIYELKKRFDLEGEISHRTNELLTEFPDWLHKASVKGKAVIIIDALNKLEDRDGAQELNWLPINLPEKVHIILSTLPGKSQNVMTQQKMASLSIEPLTKMEKKELVQKYLSQYSKQLSPIRVDRIIEDPQTSNPLGLRILLEELCQFGKHEELDDFINRYLEEDSIPNMFELVLERYEKDYDLDHAGLVKNALSLIWVSRRGLSQNELLGILGKEGNPLPNRYWSPLFLAMDKFLFDRRGTINFSHDYIREAVKNRYLRTPQDLNISRENIIGYFEKQSEVTDRKIEELPWQYLQVNNWICLYDFLSDKGVIRRFWENRTYDNDLRYYWENLEAKSDFRSYIAFQPLLGDVKNNFDIIDGISWWLRGLGHIEHAINGYSIIIKHAKGHGKTEYATYLLSEQAGWYRELGDYQKAIDVLDEILALVESRFSLQKLQAIEHEKLSNEEFTLLLTGANALQTKSEILTVNGNYEEALDNLKVIEQIYSFLHPTTSGYHMFLGDTLRLRAMILSAQGKILESLAIIEEEEQYYRMTSSKISLINTLKTKAIVLGKNKQYDEAIQELEEAITLCELQNAQRAKANLFSELSDICFKVNNFPKAEQVIRTLQELGENMRDKEIEIEAHYKLGLLQYKLGKYSDALIIFQESEKKSTIHENHYFLPEILEYKGLTLRALDQKSEAVDALKQSAQYLRITKHNRELTHVLMTLAEWYEEQGVLSEVNNLYNELLNIHIPSKDINFINGILLEHGTFFLRQKDISRANEIWRKGEKLSAERCDLRSELIFITERSRTEFLYGRAEEALVLTEKCEQAYEKLGDKEALQEALGNKSLILKKLNRPKQALQTLKDQEQICRAYNNDHGLIGALQSQASLHHALGENSSAKDALSKQELILRRINDREGLKNNLAYQVIVFKALGDTAKIIEKEQERELVTKFSIVVIPIISELSQIRRQLSNGSDKSNPIIEIQNYINGSLEYLEKTIEIVDSRIFSLTLQYTRNALQIAQLIAKNNNYENLFSSLDHVITQVETYIEENKT